MDETLIQYSLTLGPFAVLFVWLFYSVGRNQTNVPNSYIKQ
ncbi:BhlA/UviB family holin-like peptide [Ornithinibacillus bavariensis]